MTTIVKPVPPEPAAGEFAPMAPAAVRVALRGNPRALALWLEAMARPDGWDLGNRERIAADMGWTVYGVRTAITALIDAGLYVAERIQDAAGRFRTFCRMLASATSSQVTPEVDSPEVGNPARIPPSIESKREGRKRTKRPAFRHDQSKCRREALGLACRQCAELHQGPSASTATAAAPATLPASRRAADVLAAELADAAPAWAPPGGWRTLSK